MSAPVIPTLPVTPPQEDPTARSARIRRNVDRLVQQGAPRTDIDHYLQTVEGLQPKQTASTGTATGNIDLRTQRESTAVTPRPAAESSDGGILPAIQHGAEAITSGLPGGQRAVAGYRGLLSLLSGQGLINAGREVDSSLASQRQDVAKLPAVARIPLQVVGGAPAAALAAPLGVLGGGAAFGAAAGADKDAASIGDRMTHMATGAAVGAAASKGSALLGRGIANVANRTGLTDLVQRGVAFVSQSLASTMGTSGQVSAALQDRQDILDAVAAPSQTAAKVQLARIAATKARAKTLYDAARQDTRPLRDPDLQAMLDDPQVRKVFDVAAQLRDAGGTPLPRDVTTPQVPLALQKMGVSPARYQALLQLQAARSRVPVLNGTDILPPELMGGTSGGVELPDPDVVSRVKRYLYDAAQGRQNSPLAVNQDEARVLLPKVDAIRQKLHTLSPPWQQADAFYSTAKGEEEAFAHGFDAFRRANTVTGANLTVDSPEAMLAAIETPRFPGEPPAAMQSRAQAFRDGARSAAATQIRSAPVDQGLRSVLGTPALEPTQPAAQTRSLMFDSPERADALEQVLGRARGALMESTGTSSAGVPVSRYGLLKSAVKQVASSPDLLATQRGQQLLADNFREGTLTNTLDQFQQGSHLLNLPFRTPGGTQTAPAGGLLAQLIGAQVAR